MTPDYSLAGRTAVVTGALGLLGPIWIEALLDAGAAVAGLDRTEAPDSERFGALQQRFGSRLKLFRADILDRAQLAAARGQCVDRLGVPTILVNNAGLDQPPNVASPQFRLHEIPAPDTRPELRVFGDSRDHRWEGLAIGASVFGILGILMADALCNADSTSESCAGGVIMSGVVGAVVGGVLGGFIGSAIPKRGSDPADERR